MYFFNFFGLGVILLVIIRYIIGLFLRFQEKFNELSYSKAAMFPQYKLQLNVKESTTGLKEY